MQGRFEEGEREGDGGNDDEEAYKSDFGIGKRALTRRRFVKTSAAVGAAVAGIPFNLTAITDIALKEEGELLMYPVIYDFKYELVRKLPFKRFISIELFGCILNCMQDPMKFVTFKNMVPIRKSIDQITYLLLNLGDDAPSTMVVIGGGEPLLQKEEVLKLTESIKTNTDYAVMLATNGPHLDENFIDEANELNLDGIMIYYPYLVDGGYKWYAGYDNEDMITALKLVSKNFEGLQLVSLSPWLDTVTFENVCKFLCKINPNFLIKIFFHPRYPSHTEEEWKSRYNTAKRIAWRSSLRVEQTRDFSIQSKSITYLMEEDENDNVKLIKRKEWIKNKGSDESWLKTT